MLLKRESKEEVSEVCSFSIDADLTIYAIDELKEEFTKEIGESKSIELDLSDVEEVDSAGIQLLLVIDKELKRSNHTLYIKKSSVCVKKLIEQFGLANRFGMVS